MAKVKNLTGEDRWVPALNREVAAGESFDLEDEELAASFAEQPDNWKVTGLPKPKAKETTEAEPTADETGEGK